MSMVHIVLNLGAKEVHLTWKQEQFVRCLIDVVYALHN